MKLTQTQKDNIRDLKSEIAQEILHECVSNLALLTVAQYHEYSKTPKRTIYEYIKIGKIKSLTICGVIFIVMNY